MDKPQVGKYYTVKNYTRHPKDHSFRGDPFVIRHVEEPYVIVEWVDGYRKGNKYTFDLRDWELMQISSVFVESLKSNKDQEAANG